MNSEADVLVVEKRNGRSLYIGIGVSVACLAAIFLFISPREIWTALQSAQYEYLGLSAFYILLFMLFRAVRWRFMLNNVISWREVFHIQNIGYMLTNILPLRIGDVARAVLIGNVPPVTVAQGISTMVVERVFDMLFIVTLLPFTLAEVAVLPDWMQQAARISGILTLSGIVVLIVAANQRPFANRLVLIIFEKIEKYQQKGIIFFKWIPPIHPKNWSRRADNFLDGLGSLTRFKDGSILILLTLCTWFPIIGSYYSTLVAVNLEPNFTMAGFVMCIAAFSIAAPSSPGQIGVYHAGVIAALQLLGQPEAESASFAFLYHALNLSSMVLLGVIGIYGTGSAFNQVVASTRTFMQRRREPVAEQS